MFLNKTAARSLASARTVLNLTARNMGSKNAAETNSQVEPKFECLELTNPKPFVMHVQLNRPDRLNAFNNQMWLDIKSCFEALAVNPDCRAVVLSGIGKHFTAGIDLMEMAQVSQKFADFDDVARRTIFLERFIKIYQDSITSLELCPKPVISATHAGCIGAGINLITAADIRYCSEDAFFEVKEVDIGLAADVGVLQRLPKIIGSTSLVRELCFTARRVKSAEALSCGLVNRVFPNREETIEGALQLAETIAQKSPVAVQATKLNLIYSQSRPNQEGLDHIRQINSVNLQSEDLANAAISALTKGEKPVFSKL